MDNAQLLKGVLEGCVLAVIAKGETYGYEIIGELEKAGFEDIGVRKYYSITDEGSDALSDFKKRYRKISRSAETLLYDDVPADNV